MPRKPRVTKEATDKHSANRRSPAAHLAKYRWKKGDPSPNPNGRPRYTTISESLRKLLEQPISKDGPTLAEAIASIQLKKARKGDTKAFEAVANRAEGKPTQPIDLSGGLVIENTESRKEWAEAFLETLMIGPPRLTRAKAIALLKKESAASVLKFLGEE